MKHENSSNTLADEVGHASWGRPLLVYATADSVDHF